MRLTTIVAFGRRFPLGRFWVVPALTALLGACMCASSSAQNSDERGRLAITLIASSDARPLAGQVAIRGPIITMCQSGPDGHAFIESLPAGRYIVRASAPGFRPSPAHTIELNQARRAITIELVENAPMRRIGHVVTAFGGHADPRSVAHSLSSDLLEAAGASSGVNSSFDVAGEAQPTISLEGHPAESVAQTIDGLPIGGPGIRSLLGFINPDLLGGIGTTFGPVPGSSGGSIDFHTLDPTLFWNGEMRARDSTFGSNGVDLSERGSIGSIGVAYEHADRATRGAIDGRDFFDASGASFTHSDLSHDLGDLIKLRLPLASAGFVQTTVIDDARTADQTCGSLTAAVPCSFGPDARTHDRLGLVAEQLVTTVGATAVSASLSHIGVREWDAGSAPGYAASSAAGFSTSEQTLMTGFALGADTPIAAHQQLSLRFSGGSVNRSYEQDGAVVGDALHYGIGAIADRLRLSDRLELTFHVSETQTNYGGTGSAAGVQTMWSTPKTGRFALDIAGGAGNPQAPSIDFLTDPNLLTYSCAARAAFGATGGDARSNATQTSARGSWSVDYPYGQFRLTAYTQNIRDATIPAIVDATALGLLPSGYLAAATQAYHDPLVCGQSEAAPGAPTIYLSTLVAGANEQFSGLRVDSDLHAKRLGGHIFLDLTHAVANTADPRLTNGTSLTPPGSQLLGIPRVRAGADVSYDWPGLRGLLSLALAGANNARNLPAYAVLTAGVEKHFPGMVATAYVTNLFNTYAGTFATTALGEPLHTSAGTSVPFAGIPFAPREFRVAVRFGVGPDRVGLTATGDVPVQTSPLTPEQRISGFPAQPPLQPFRVAADAAGCSREDAALDRKIFDPVARFVGLAQKPATTATPQISTLDGIEVEYIPQKTAYALVISTGRIDALRAIANCNVLHFGSVDDAHRYSAYVPAAVSRFRQKVMFTPALGLYLVSVPHPEHDDPRVYSLSAGITNGAAFALHAACPAEVRPAVEPALGDLSRYFTGSADEVVPGSWRIVKHGGAGGPWYSLYNNDAAIVNGLIACAHVSGATPAELARRGLGAQPQPYLNYAPAIGLYVLVIGLDDPAP